MTHGYNIYMTEVAADGSLAGQLAESWEPSADVAAWTFNLRKGVVYHNGREVVAEDVVASINHHRREDSTSAAKPIVAPITDIKAQGKHTVVFTLDAGNADFPFILTDYHLPIMPSEGGKPDWQSGIGAGAYKIKSFDPGVRIDLERHGDYWDSGRGHFDAVQMITIVDPAARTNAVITGEVDAIDRVDLKTVHLLKRRKGLTVHSVAGTQHYTFPMRTNVAPFDDNNVRMAIKHAINREEMVEKILQGFGVVGNDHPIGPGQRYFAKDLEQRTYDPDRAKHYLKQAGMDSLAVDLSVADAAFAGAVDAGALFAESAKAAGINLNIVREPNDGYWSNVWNSKPFTACYWGGRPVEDQMFSTAYASGAAWNDTAWEHERFNMLLKEARGGSRRGQAPRNVRGDAAARARRGRGHRPDVRLLRLRHIRQGRRSGADGLELGPGRRALDGTLVVCLIRFRASTSTDRCGACRTGRNRAAESHVYVLLRAPDGNSRSRTDCARGTS